MSAATEARNTKERPGLIFNYPVAAATTIYQGTQVAVNSSGYAVPAADTSGLRVIGRAEETVTNSGSAGDLTINVKRGVFLFDNSGTSAVDADDIGKFAFVEDDQTIAESSTNKVIAGRVVGVVTEGVWIDTTYAYPVPSADTLTALTFSTDATGAEVAALRAAVLAILQAQGLVR